MSVLADKIIQEIDQAATLYHRLILVVAPTGSGKTSAFLDVQKQTGAPVFNVNLELSRLMLELTERQRSLQIPRLLSEIASGSKADMVLLDNIEMLFDVTLKQDPLRLLQGLSRNMTVVVAWNGIVDGNYLVYAKPDHPEYRRYPIADLRVVSP